MISPTTKKATLYNQILQRYLSYYDQKWNDPLKVSFSTPGAKETNEQAVEIQDIDKSTTSDDENDELKNKPSGVCQKQFDREANYC